MDDTELDEVQTQKNSVNLTIEIPELSTDIQELEKKVNSIFDNDVTTMLEKSKKLLEIKDDIKKEQDNINYMIDKISDLSPKKSKKLKNLTLDDLVSLFEKEEDINNKIKIYQNICYIIDKFKNKLFD
tara:strand:- start:2980 stop:3363 length:384 start_codon:yes stop_codon:yes gene_type:complete